MKLKGKKRHDVKHMGMEGSQRKTLASIVAQLRVRSVL